MDWQVAVKVAWAQSLAVSYLLSYREGPMLSFISQTFRPRWATWRCYTMIKQCRDGSGMICCCALYGKWYRLCAVRILRGGMPCIALWISTDDDAQCE